MKIILPHKVSWKKRTFWGSVLDYPLQFAPLLASLLNCLLFVRRLVGSGTAALLAKKKRGTKMTDFGERHTTMDRRGRGIRLAEETPRKLVKVGERWAAPPCSGAGLSSDTGPGESCFGAAFSLSYIATDSG